MTEAEIVARRGAFDGGVGAALDAMALLSVHEVGVFTALVEGPATAAELGQRCAVSPWRLGAFLDRTAALGFLAKEGERYALVAGDQALFAGGVGQRAGLTFTDSATFFARLARGTEVLRTDVAIPVAGTGGDATAEERARFLRHVHERSLAGAAEVAKLLLARPVTRLVDLGSGLGTYATALLREAPAATAVLVDRPNAAPVVEAHIHEAGLEGRARFLAADFVEEDFGEGFDLALLSNIAHNIGADAMLKTLRRLRHALRPGGRVAIKDLVVDADRLGPSSAGRFALSMALFTERGGVFPAGEVADWLEATGFGDVETHQLRDAAGSYLVVGHLR